MLKKFGNKEATDAELICRLQKGDSEAFTGIYYKYNKLLYAIAYKYLQDSETVEDIVQHVFLKLWESRTLLQESMNLRNFLYTMTKNHVLNEIRNLTTAMEKNYEMIQEKPESEDTLQQQIENRDLIASFHSVMKELPSRQRQVCFYRLEEGLSAAEVADKMGVSVSTVKTLFQLGIKTIRLKMGKLLLLILMFFQ